MREIRNDLAFFYSAMQIQPINTCHTEPDEFIEWILRAATICTSLFSRAKLKFERNLKRLTSLCRKSRCERKQLP